MFQQLDMNIRELDISLVSCLVLPIFRAGFTEHKHVLDRNLVHGHMASTIYVSLARC